MKKKPHQIKKLKTDLINKVNKYPQENIINHPIVLKSTVSGALLTGIIVAVIAWVFSSEITNWENLSFISPGIFIIIGFISGSAVGGLVGNLYGIFLMLKERG